MAADSRWRHDDRRHPVSFAANTSGGNATGTYPFSGLIADAEGNLYGTTYQGGTNDKGTVFELVKGANGYTQQTLFSFAANPYTGNTTGAGPFAGLTADAQGNLYGTTGYGGAHNTGVVFELVKGANGYTQLTLFSFAANSIGTGNTTGANPWAGLTADAQGNLYGTTVRGGANDTGAVYELVKGANGYTQQTLFSFAANSSAGNATWSKSFAGLTADAQGNLYGTTVRGGANDTPVRGDASGHATQTSHRGRPESSPGVSPR